MRHRMVIVGSGIIGLSVARSLATVGDFDLTLVDQSASGRGSSWAGAGILPPGDPAFANTPVDRLRAWTRLQFPRVSEELRKSTGIDNGYRACGGLELLDSASADEVHDWQAQNIDCVPLGNPPHPAAAGVVVPDGHRAFYLKDYAQVRNPRHLKALTAEFRARPRCRLIEDRAVVSLTFAGSRVTGVTLASGECLDADTVVLSAGAWSGPILKRLGVTIPVEPVRGQMVVYECETRLLDCVVLCGRQYLVPRDDNVLLVGSTEGHQAGFDTADDDAAIEQLHGFAVSLVPALSGARPVRSWAGLRPSSPDGRPTIGRVPGHENVIVATGHFRRGIQQSLATAELVRYLVTGTGEPVADPAAFAPTRDTTNSELSLFRS